MRFALTLAAGVVFGGLGLGAISASAAPAMPQPGVLAGEATVEHVRMNNRRGSMMRHKRRMNTMRHGNPNARNPSQPGDQQQLGNTSGGPRH